MESTQTCEDKSTPPSGEAIKELAQVDDGKFNIYIIYSESGLDWLWETCKQHGPNEHIGLMRIDHDRKTNGDYSFLDNNGYLETNRTIVALHPSLYNKLKEEGYGDRRQDVDFRITEYYIREGNYPPEECAYALYIPLPLDKLSIEDCKAQLSTKINKIVSMGFMKGNEYQVHYPHTTREHKVADYRGYAIVTFSPKVDRLDCVKIKIILDQTKWWCEDTPLICRCSWAKQKAINAIRSLNGGGGKRRHQTRDGSDKSGSWKTVGKK